MPFHAPRHMTRGVCVEQRPRWFALLSPKASPVAASFELTQAGRSWISPRPRSVVTRVSMWKVVDTDRPAGKVWKVVDTDRPAGGKVVDTHRPAGKGVESRGHPPTWADGKSAGCWKVGDTHRPEFPPPDRDCHESDGILADGASTEAGLPCQLRGSASSMAMPSGRTT